MNIPMPRATGFQIAFLVLAVEFFSMLLSRQARHSLGWPDEAFEFLGPLISLAIAAVVLFGIPPLRRTCLDALRIAVPGGMSAELLAVALAKCSIPFAVLGALAGWELVAGTPERIPQQLRAIDPDQAWAWTLSPMGLARMVMLSWLAGPILEELVFRGFLYRAWERQWGWKASLVLTSACFGLAHPAHIASAFLGSVVYICVLRRTGCLRAPIFVHILFNVLVSWPLLGQVLHRAPAGDSASASTWALPLACLAFASVALPAYLRMAQRAPRAAAAFPPST